MNSLSLFDYPERMIYPNDDRQAFENYSDVQYIPGIACCLHRFENFPAWEPHDRIVSLSRYNSRWQG